MAGFNPNPKSTPKLQLSDEQKRINEAQRKARTPAKPATSGGRGGRPTGPKPAPTSAPVQKTSGPLQQLGDAIKGSRYIGPAIKEIGDALAPVNPVPPAKAQQTSPTKRPSPQQVLGKLWNDTSSTTKRALVETTKDALGRDLFAPLVFGSSVRGTENYSGRQLGQGLVSAATSTATWLYSTTTEDVNSGPIGQFLNQLPEALNPLFGGKPPSEMTPQELDAFRMKGSLTGNLILSRVNPFAGAMTRAKTIGQFSVSAGRAAAFQEIGSAAVTDPRGGNAIDFVNAVSGTNLPGGVTADDSYFQASIKSIPGDAFFGWGLGRAGGAAVGVTVKGAQLTLNAAGIPLNAIKRRVARNSAAKTEQAERAWQEANGFTTQDPESGAHDFTPDFKKQLDKREGKAPSPPAGDAAPDGPITVEPMDPGVDPWYDPALPTSTTLGSAINDLPDPVLYEISRGTGPVAARVEQALRVKNGIDAEAPTTAPPDGPPMVAEGTELWHGTSPEIGASIQSGGFKPSKTGVMGGGSYFTTNPRYAGAYGEVAITGGLPKGARVLDLVAEGKSVNDFAKEIGVGEPAEAFEDMRFFSDEQQAAIRTWADDNGYDGIQFDPVTEAAPGTGTPELVMFNKDAANLIAGAPVDRDGIKAKLLREAITNGEVRPPDAQIPELSEPSVRLDQIDMDKPVTPGSLEAQALVDEIRLTAQDMAEQDAINLAVKKAVRESEGYDLKTFEQKKSEGLFSGYSKAEEDEVLSQLDEAAKAYGKSIDKGLELASDMRRLADEIDTGEANARAELSEWVQPTAPTPPERPTPVRMSSTGDQPSFALPPELSKAAPRYGSRQVQFESDLDRAAYILLADAKKGTSKAAAKFREALVTQGLDPAAVAEHGLRVKAALRKSTPNGAGVIDLPAQRWTDDTSFMASSPEESFIESASKSIDERLRIKIRDLIDERLRIKIGDLEELRANMPIIVQELRKLGGNRAEIMFNNYITKSRPAAWGGGEKKGNILGYYKWKDDLIGLALGVENLDPRTSGTAGLGMRPLQPEQVFKVGTHEIGHMDLRNAFTDPEVAQVNSFLGRMKVLLYNLTGAIPEPVTSRSTKGPPNFWSVLKGTGEIAYDELWNETYRQLVDMKRAGLDPRETLVQRMMELVPEPRNPNAVWTAAKKELESITRRVAGTFADVFDEL